MHLRYLAQKSRLQEQELHKLVTIVRAADTDRFDLAPQAAGLWAISTRLSYNIRDDHQMLAYGMVMYDALYSWLKNVPDEKQPGPINCNPYARTLSL